MLLRGVQSAFLESARNESDNFHDILIFAKGFSHLVDALGKSATLIKQHLIGMAQIMDGFAGKAPTLHANNIQPAQMRPITDHRAKGNDIILHAGHAANKGMLTHTGELDDSRQTSDNRMIPDFTMAGNGGVT